MELGADGVLLNTAVSGAKDPIKMAQAMKLSIEAGRLDLKQVALHVSVVQLQVVL